MAVRRLSAVRLPWDNLSAVPLTDKFQHILSLFPQNLVFAFAYGSGAFQQHGHQSVEVSKYWQKVVLLANLFYMHILCFYTLSR
jgi:hypothetical protein